MASLATYPYFIVYGKDTEKAIIDEFGSLTLVIGDSVNTVFRLQTIAKVLPNGILISENTRRAARSRLNFKEFGEFEIDSTIDKLKVYELLGQEKY